MPRGSSSPEDAPSMTAWYDGDGHPEATQPSMAAYSFASEAHWQAKSTAPQPMVGAPLRKHDWAHWGITARAMAAQFSAFTTASSPIISSTAPRRYCILLVIVVFILSSTTALETQWRTAERVNSFSLTTQSRLDSVGGEEVRQARRDRRASPDTGA